MSTAWRAENRVVNRNAAVCSYVPVSWLKSGRVEKLYLGPVASARRAGGHGAGAPAP